MVELRGIQKNYQQIGKYTYFGKEFSGVSAVEENVSTTDSWVYLAVTAPCCPSSDGIGAERHMGLAAPRAACRLPSRCHNNNLQAKQICTISV